MKQHSFLELLNADVSKWCDDKGGLTYLRWSAALALVMQADPCFTWKAALGEDFTPFFPHGEAGGFVRVSVTYQGRQTTVNHPVLNGHKVIKAPSVFDINKAVYRGLVKAIAIASGIGLRLWMGQGEIPVLAEALEAFDPHHFLAQVNKPGAKDEWTMEKIHQYLDHKCWPYPDRVTPDRRMKLINHLRGVEGFFLLEGDDPKKADEPANT